MIKAEMAELPLVSQFPGLGARFTYSRDRRVEEELLLLIATRVVEPTGQ
jgi:hypothetical protein